MLVVGSALVMVMLVVLPAGELRAAPPAAPAKAELEKLYELAKKEGVVSYSAGTSRQAVAKLFEAFSRKYPGLKLEYLEQMPSEAMARLIAEATAGRLSTDVTVIGREGSFPFEDRDMLAQYDWNRVFGIPNEAIEKGGKLLKFYNQAEPILYNTKLVAPKHVPKSYENLLDLEFKGLIGIELGMKQMSLLAMAIGEERVKDLLITTEAEESEAHFHKRSERPC